MMAVAWTNRGVQADLVSVITALYGLGLPLLAVECLATEPFLGTLNS
jgi:hypothetical protein